MAKICKYCGAMNGEQAVVCSRCHKPLQGGAVPDGTHMIRRIMNCHHNRYKKNLQNRQLR